MKYLVLALVLLVALFWLGRGRRRGDGGSDGKGGGSAGRRAGAAGRGDAAPATMIACAHCGVHLPQPDAFFDAGGRPYCSEAHRLAGPR